MSASWSENTHMQVAGYLELVTSICNKLTYQCAVMSGMSNRHNQHMCLSQTCCISSFTAAFKHHWVGKIGAGTIMQAKVATSRSLATIDYTGIPAHLMAIRFNMSENIWHSWMTLWLTAACRGMPSQLLWYIYVIPA